MARLGIGIERVALRGRYYYEVHVGDKNIVSMEYEHEIRCNKSMHSHSFLGISTRVSEIGK